MLHFPKATYMYWQKRFDKEDPDKAIKEEILELHERNKDYGYRRITGILRERGHKINKKRVQRLMRVLNIKVQSYTRKSRRYNSYTDKTGPVAPNRLNRRFETSIPHQKITTDTTEFKYYEVDKKGTITIKKLYLDPFLDLFNREIISYSIRPKPSAEGIMSALNQAIEVTNDCKYRRTFHSDQGWGYKMHMYRDTLKENRIFQSMSRKGNCYDNAVMENFFGIMKQEMYYGKIYRTYEELEAAIIEYIKYYNERRIKEKLGWKSPVDYRICYQLQAAA